MPDPKKNVAYTFDVPLINASSRPDLKASPTLAAGDVKVSTDEGAFANITSLPTVTPAAGVNVKVALTAGEMNGDRVVITFIDQTSPKEWDDVYVWISTTPPLTQPSGVFAWPAFLDDIAAWLGALGSNKIKETATLQTLRNRADSVDVATAAVSDDGVTGVRGSFT